MNKKHNFSVRLRPNNPNRKKSNRNQRKLSVEEENQILVKKFLRKWKQSGILRELKQRQYPKTRGMKEREKRFLGKKRSRKNLKR